MAGMTIQNILRDLVASGMSQTQIEKQTGVRQPSISRVLTGVQADLSFADGKKIESLHKRRVKRKAA